MRKYFNIIVIVLSSGTVVQYNEEYFLNPEEYYAISLHGP